MKRQKRKAKSTAKARAQQGAMPQKATEPRRSRVTRRDFMGNLVMGGVAVLAVGGGAGYLISDVMADIAEHDLERIGNGIPTVVQVHDPSCPTCLSLQREVRQAMKSFDEAELQYLIANLTTEEGRALANQYGVGKITLLLMDGQGKRLRTLTGPSSSDVLESLFQSHLERVRRRS